MAALTPYAILEVSVDATAQQIRKRYHELARTLHPDANLGEAVDQQWYLVSSAYRLLTDEQARNAWHRALGIRAGLCQRCTGVGVVTGRRASTYICKGCAGTGIIT